MTSRRGGCDVTSTVLNDRLRELREATIIRPAGGTCPPGSPSFAHSARRVVPRAGPSGRVASALALALARQGAPVLAARTLSVWLDASADAIAVFSSEGECPTCTAGTQTCW